MVGMSVFLGFVSRSPRLLEVSLVQSLQDFANKLGFFVYCDTLIAAS